jgi:hypothetical protein
VALAIGVSFLAPIVCLPIYWQLNISNVSTGAEEEGGFALEDKVEKRDRRRIVLQFEVVLHSMCPDECILYYLNVLKKFWFFHMLGIA